jgi:plasmid stabilization system protein ParE
MASVRYAPLAEDDLDDVAVWTRKQFGEAQVRSMMLVSG